MLLLRPMLPMRVPDHVPEAPAAVMSEKSTSDIVAKAAAVIVRVVPLTLLETLTRVVAVPPVPRVRVPLIVWLAAIDIGLYPAVAGLVKVRLLKVLFVPVMVMVVVTVVDVKLTL